MKTIEMDLPLKEYTENIIDVFFDYTKQKNIDMMDIRVFRWYPKPGSQMCRLHLKLGIRHQHLITDVQKIIEDMEIVKRFNIPVSVF